LKKSSIIKFLVLVLLFFTGCFLSLFFGGTENILSTDLNQYNFIFWQIRVPKTVTAIIAGSALSVAGLILQIIFRNPLAGPYVLGISSGASLMVAVSVMAGNAFRIFSDFFIGKSVILFSAIVGSFLITSLILLISKKVKSNTVLLLIGLMISQICGAIQTALEYFSDPNSLKAFVVWGMGSLANTTNYDLILFIPIAFICMTALLFFVKPLNALLLGQNYAQNVGIDFNRSRFYLILISSVLTGLTTAFCGPIAFVGIAVPILSRMLFKTSRQEVHIISGILIGSIILLFSDAFCNSVLKTAVLPINMITTFIGAPLVIYLMFRNKHW
jgi:iron complex transport system permease protein